MLSNFLTKTYLENCLKYINNTKYILNISIDDQIQLFLNFVIFVFWGFLCEFFSSNYCGYLIWVST